MSDLQATSARAHETWTIREDLLVDLIFTARMHVRAVEDGDVVRAHVAQFQFLRTEAALQVARAEANAAWTAYMAAVDQELAALREATR